MILPLATTYSYGATPTADQVQLRFWLFIFLLSCPALLVYAVSKIEEAEFNASFFSWIFWLSILVGIFVSPAGRSAAMPALAVLLLCSSAELLRYGWKEKVRGVAGLALSGFFLSGTVQHTFPRFMDDRRDILTPVRYPGTLLMLDWLKRLFNPRTKLVAPPALGFRTEDGPSDADAPDPTCPEHPHLPAIYLRSSKAAGFSRLGGLPRMPSHFAWPKFKGRPLAFLAQIDLSELHAALPSFLPASGFLFFFYDQDQSAWGSGPEDLGAWRVLYFEGDVRDCLPRAAPEGLDPRCIYRDKPVSPVLVDLQEESASLSRQPRHQMLGFSTSAMDPLDLDQQRPAASSDGLIRGDATLQYPSEDGVETGEADWKLLLEFSSDDETGWAWGDVGTLYFWIGEQDARQRDFSKVWMTLESS